MPETLKRRPSAKQREIADAKILHDQALTHFAEGGYTGRKQPKWHTKETLLRCARAAYKSFVKEAGYEHDARITEFDRLSPLHQGRWSAIARAVLDTAG